MICKFCNEEMKNCHFSWTEYVDICKNHDVIYIEHDNWTMFGKDGCEIRISKKGDVYYSKFGGRSLHIKEPTYFKGYVYGHNTFSKKLIMGTEDIEINVNNFDKVVKKLEKLVMFS